VTTDDSADSDRFSATENEVREALVLLGTNNLPLLVRWIDWEHTLKTRAVRAVFNVSPNWLLQSGIFDFMVTERRDLALSLRAMEVFRVLGPRAAPAIPRLTQLVMKRDPASGRSVLRAMEHIGEPSTPAIVSLASSSKCPCRIDAVGLLWAHTNSPAVRIVLISAKSDPDLDVRRAAIHALNGEPSF
jgi:HEAT repeat protein